jgi:SAM-dependent methyltransferase
MRRKRRGDVTRRPRAEEHDEFYRTPFGRQVLEAEVRLLLEQLPEEGRVLSLGCGIGLHEEMLERMRPGMVLVCLDIQAEMLAMAPPHLHRVRADMTAPPFPDGAFDAAYAVTSLEFVRDPARALREVARTIGPGGRLVLHALNPVSDWGRTRLRQLPATWGTREELERMVADATGGPVETTFALDLEDDVLTEPAGFGDAALLVLTSVMKTNKS